MTGAQTAEAMLRASFLLAPRERVATLERAAELADAEQNPDLGFRIRKHLVSSTYRVPSYVELVTAYSWLVAKSDEDPARFKLNLWYYKWIPTTLVEVAAIDETQLNALVEDLDARFRAAGQPPTAALKIRMVLAQDMGRIQEAEDHLAAWKQAARIQKGSLHDCQACTDAAELSVLIDLGRHDQALQVGKGLIDGNLRCSHQPHGAFAELLRPARVAGPAGLATSIRKRGYALIRKDPFYLSEVAYYIRDSLHQGDLRRATELVGRHQRWLETHEHRDRAVMVFCMAVRAVVLRHRHLGRPDPIVLGELRGSGPSGQDRSATQVADDLIDRAEDLGARFDARNGNGCNERQLAVDLEWATR